NEEHTARFVATEASFDASGGFVAITGYDVASQAPWVWAGVPDDVAAVDLAAARSPVWHSTDVGYLAWLATVGDDLMLRTGRMNPLSRMLREVADVTSVPEGSQLVRWDSAGFVVNAGQDGTIVLDSHGSEVWTHPGRTVSASHDTIMLADGTRPDTTEGPDEIMATVYTFSRTGEEGARFIDSEPPAPLQTHRSGWISSATDLTARVDVIDQSTSLEVTGSAMATIRKLKIADDVLPAGFIHNDAFFVFRADAGNDLIFVNWNVGSSHVLPIPDQYSIIGFGTG
ncbi:MAG: hypothetical protein KDB69_02185, partial [Acidimicrobiia bacterium]|nr:hypothetical protein [Acidimicrobiia bacterium]